MLVSRPHYRVIGFQPIGISIRPANSYKYIVSQQIVQYTVQVQADGTTIVGGCTSLSYSVVTSYSVVIISKQDAESV